MPFAQVLIGIARPLYADDPMGVELNQNLYALDSTTIDLCLSLFPWAKFRRNKAAVKMHTLLDRKRSSNPPSQAAEPVVKCGYGASDERSQGKTTDQERDSADCGGVCNERHATE
jgi:hypothetical protein